MRIKKLGVDYVLVTGIFSFDGTKFPFYIKYIGDNISMKHICLKYLEYVYEE